MNIFDIKRLPKGLLILIPSDILLVIFLLPMFSGIINTGNVAGVIFCVCVDLIWVFYPLIKRVGGLFILFKASLAVFAVGLCYVGFLSVNMFFVATQKPENMQNNATVIVLGCHVRPDGSPSRMLRYRLEAARELLLENENLMCVVTGGQGENEPATEASVMRDWLVRSGISNERIFLEDKSTSTYENLKFAREIMMDNNLPQSVVVVSDGFHLYRARMYAREHFENVGTYAAQTDTVVLPTYWVREWFAITREKFF
jgi:uncharacterized SAM-binding protein YcdF (DUF218 family)